MIGRKKKPDGVSPWCEYAGCKEPAVGDVRFNGHPHPLCVEHLTPEYHPIDLREKLTHWATA